MRAARNIIQPRLNAKRAHTAPQKRQATNLEYLCFCIFSESHECFEIGFDCNFSCEHSSPAMVDGWWSLRIVCVCVCAFASIKTDLFAIYPNRFARQISVLVVFMMVRWFCHIITLVCQPIYGADAATNYAKPISGRIYIFMVRRTDRSASQLDIDKR